MNHIKGLVTKPAKEDTQAHAKYMKGEGSAQRILIESIKDSNPICIKVGNNKSYI